MTNQSTSGPSVHPGVTERIAGETLAVHDPDKQQAFKAAKDSLETARDKLRECLGLQGSFPTYQRVVLERGLAEVTDLLEAFALPARPPASMFGDAGDAASWGAL